MTPHPQPRAARPSWRMIVAAVGCLAQAYYWLFVSYRGAESWFWAGLLGFCGLGFLLTEYEHHRRLRRAPDPESEGDEPPLG